MGRITTVQVIELEFQKYPLEHKEQENKNIKKINHTGSESKLKKKRRRKASQLQTKTWVNISSRAKDLVPGQVLANVEKWVENKETPISSKQPDKSKWQTPQGQGSLLNSLITSLPGPTTVSESDPA